VEVIPAVTGPYTIDCTTRTAGPTGDFHLQINPGQIDSVSYGTPPNNNAYQLIYCPESNRLVALNNSSIAPDPYVAVINPCTMAAPVTFYLPGGVTNVPMCSCYNPLLEIVYIIGFDNVLYSLDPVTYAFTALVSGGLYGGTVAIPAMAFDPVTNKLFVSRRAGGAVVSTGIRIFECTGHTEIDFIATTNNESSMEVSDTGYVYFKSTAPALKKINTVTHAITTTAASVTSSPVSVLNEQGLLVSSIPGGFIGFFDTATDTLDSSLEVFGVTANVFDKAVWNPNRELVCLSMGINADYLMHYDLDTQEVIEIKAAEYARGATYVDQSNCCYASGYLSCLIYKFY